MIKENKNEQKGVSLYFAVVVTSLLLAISFGLVTIFIGQLNILREIGDSVQAFFAADSGMEKIFYLERTCSQTGCISGLCNASCTGFALNPYPTSSQPGDWTDASTSFDASAASTSASIIFRAKGIYKKTQRAIEAVR